MDLCLWIEASRRSLRARTRQLPKQDVAFELGAAPVAFFACGANYLCKMATDLRFLQDSEAARRVLRVRVAKDHQRHDDRADNPMLLPEYYGVPEQRAGRTAADELGVDLERARYAASGARVVCVKKKFRWVFKKSG